jgi:hypothetical protein
MKVAESWMATQRKAWGKRLDQLDDYLHEMKKRKEPKR